MKVAELDRAWSPVYRNTRAPPGPVKAQITYFCLNPLPLIHRVQPGKEEVTKTVHELITPEIIIAAPSDFDLTAISTASTPLPIFREKRLMRKPTVEKAEPLKNDDKLFIVFSKMTELGPLDFKTTTDSYKFYRKHFPLLLALKVERFDTPSNRRTLTPPMDTMIKRRLVLNQRLNDLETMMAAMEQETEDFPFKTELHSSVFDPTKWSFTKVDPARMRRRYTIDALLKEINK